MLHVKTELDPEKYWCKKEWNNTERSLKNAEHLAIFSFYTERTDEKPDICKKCIVEITKQLISLLY